jgi:hypothetical protein
LAIALIVEEVRVLILALPVYVVDCLAESLCVLHASSGEKNYFEIRVKFD